MNFVHLHVHSHYSLLDGLSKIPNLVKTAKQQGSPALALTDHGAMYGAIEFYEECHKAGIKPIIGCEVYVTAGKLTEKTSPAGKKNYYHLTLLAKSQAGYLNLMKITTQAHLEGYYYRPRIDHEFLSQHAEGLVCLSGCMRGELPAAILENDMEEARKMIEWHRQTFDDYYLEMQHHPNLPDQAVVNRALKDLAKEYDLPLVVTTDSHYLCTDDVEAHDVLLCVQTGAKVTDENRFSMKGEVFDLTDPKVLAEAFVDTPEAISNTVKIAQDCEVEINLNQIILPRFDLPKGETDSKIYLRKLVAVGAKRRFDGQVSKAVQDRLDYELGVIEQMHYESYFLVVEDFVRWSKENGVVVGPGRGSGAASMVSYCLYITDLDPLEYGLLFERFLNPERISMPDFDIDFADDRRGEVIQYVVDRYGKDRVAQIITFGTMAARASIRDTGRALGVSYADVDRIAKLVPLGFGLKDAVKAVDELSVAYETEPQIKKLIDLAGKLEGVVRHASTHAAGVVIADKDLVNYTPLQHSSKGEISRVTQYSMGPIERLGLLKIDFLGLKNLTIIKNALRIIRKVKNQEIDIAKIPLDDLETYQLLARGATIGVFQLESEGMRRNLQELKPSVFGDITAMVALYRPGPMELIPDFVARKHGHKKIEYLHPKLEPILKETYGIAVYQEQVLQMARDLCGFSLGEADVLRKAIGKKIKTLLMEQKKKWVNGGIENGLDKKLAEKLFEFVEPFARYGFNKAHAASYAMIAYQTAYLKTHFPNEFMAALLTADQGDLDKVAKNISEAEHMGIKVLPPSVNESFTDFAVVKDTGDIRFGFNVIKNVGHKVSDLIVEERDKNGMYKSLPDFLGRVPKEALNKKVLESLSKVGAMDEFGDRKELFSNVDVMVDFVAHRNRGDSSQMGIFGEEFDKDTNISLRTADKSSEKERLSWEKELLGAFVSNHPLKALTPQLKGKVKEIGSLHQDMDNHRVKVCGLVASIKKVQTKKNEPMMFVRFEDLTGSLEVIVFPKILEQHSDLFAVNKILVIDGKVNVKDRVIDEGGETSVISEAKVIVDSATEVTESYLARLVSEQNAKTQPITNDTPVPASHFRYSGESLVIRLPKNFANDRLKSLKQVLEKHNGTTPVELEIFAKGSWQRLKTKTRTARSNELERELAKELI